MFQFSGRSVASFARLFKSSSLIRSSCSSRPLVEATTSSVTALRASGRNFRSSMSENARLATSSASEERSRVKYNSARSTVTRAISIAQCLGKIARTSSSRCAASAGSPSAAADNQRALATLSGLPALSNCSSACSIFSLPFATSCLRKASKARPCQHEPTKAGRIFWL